MTRNWTFDLALDFPHQGSGSGVHWICPCKSLGFSVPLGSVADGPFLPTGTGRSQAGSDPVNPVAPVDPIPVAPLMPLRDVITIVDPLGTIDDIVSVVPLIE